jgi:hypothetical protein
MTKLQLPGVSIFSIHTFYVPLSPRVSLGQPVLGSWSSKPGGTFLKSHRVVRLNLCFFLFCMKSCPGVGYPSRKYCQGSDSSDKSKEFVGQGLTSTTKGFWLASQLDRNMLRRRQLSTRTPDEASTHDRCRGKCKWDHDWSIFQQSNKLTNILLVIYSPLF